MPRSQKERKKRKCERCIASKTPCSGTQPCLTCQEAGQARQCLFRGGLRILEKSSRDAIKDGPSVVSKGKQRSLSHSIESHNSQRANNNAEHQTYPRHDIPLIQHAFREDDFYPGPEAAPAASSSSSSSQEVPHTIPFFRYFGNTAIAPGIRFVEVELKEDQTTVFHEHGGNDNQTTLSNTPSTVNDSFPPIFDESNPSLPNQRLLRHLIPLFFSHMSCHLPFLSESKVQDSFEQGSLEPLEANCICALASRFSDLPELVALREARGKYTSAEPFAAMAKDLVVPLFSVPSLKVCQALLMITWIEWGSDRDAGAWLWSGLAIRISQDLGLQYADTLLSLPDKETQREHKLTFWAVYFLDRMISYGAGRTVAILQSSIEIDWPSNEECHSTRKQGLRQLISHPWPYLLMLLGHRGEISDKLNQRSLQNFFFDITQGRQSMMTFFHSLPPDLRFNVSNLQKLSQMQLAQLLVIMHCMFHSLICLLHRPSLLQKDQAAISSAATPSDLIMDVDFDKNLCSSSAKTISDILSFSLVLDEKTIIANPYMDHAVYIGSLALLEELEELEIVFNQNSSLFDSTEKGRLWQRGSIIDKFETTRDCLDHLAQHWGGIAWVCDWLGKRSASLPELKRYEDSRAIYRAAPASVRMDMIKYLSKTHPSGQKLLKVHHRPTGSTTSSSSSSNVSKVDMIDGSNQDKNVLELDWSALQSAVNANNVIFDGIHNVFVPNGGVTEDSSLYHFAM